MGRPLRFHFVRHQNQPPAARPPTHSKTAQTASAASRAFHLRQRRWHLARRRSAARAPRGFGNSGPRSSSTTVNPLAFADSSAVSPLSRFHAEHAAGRACAVREPRTRRLRGPASAIASLAIALGFCDGLRLRSRNRRTDRPIASTMKNACNSSGRSIVTPASPRQPP